jgi:hypothetical protein
MIGVQTLTKQTTMQSLHACWYCSNRVTNELQVCLLTVVLNEALICLMRSHSSKAATYTIKPGSNIVRQRHCQTQ